jgi:hypothetical protein
MTAASEVLADRAALTAASGRLGAPPPNDVEARFEEAATIDALDALESDLEQRAAVAEALVATRDRLAAPRTPLADLGLAGEQPVAGLDAALAAFSAGDLEAAVAGSTATTALLAGAEEVGRGRAVAVAVVVGLGLLLLAAWLVRRRRRATDLGTSPDAPTTLAATPDPAAADAGAPPGATPPATTPAATRPVPGVDPD